MTTVTLAELKLDDLNPDPQNRDVGDVSELAASIAKLGVLEPILVAKHTVGTTDGKLWIVAGERRWLAAKAAKLKTIPAVIRELSERERVEMQLVENLHRSDLNPIEEATQFARLVTLNVKVTDIAKLVGRKQTYVKNRLALLEIPERVQDQVATGDINLSEAATLVEIIREDTPAAKEQLEEIIGTDEEPDSGGLGLHNAEWLRNRRRDATIRAEAEQLAIASGVPLIEDGVSTWNLLTLQDVREKLKEKGEKPPTIAALKKHESTRVKATVGWKGEEQVGKLTFYCIRPQDYGLAAKGGTPAKTPEQKASRKKFLAEQRQRKVDMAELVRSAKKAELDDLLVQLVIDELPWAQANKGTAEMMGIEPKTLVGDYLKDLSGIKQRRQLVMYLAHRPLDVESESYQSEACKTLRKWMKAKMPKRRKKAA